MVGSSLPPGFRFHPTDEELVGYYLKRRVEGLKIELEVIPVIDFYKFEPWQLPEKSFLPNRDMEWFFFCARDRKYPNGSRTNRATKSGYWKATGKDRKVVCGGRSSSVIGYRKTLVFYLGRAPLGDRTEWLMHEYRLCDDSQNFKGAFALCRVVKKNEHMQKKSASHGEPVGKHVETNSSNEDLISARVSNEPLSIYNDISCHTSNPYNESRRSSRNTSPYPYGVTPTETGSSSIRVSPHLILESSKDYPQVQEAASQYFQQNDHLPVSTQNEYTELCPPYSNFDWETEQVGYLSPNIGFENLMELHGDGDMLFECYDQTATPNYLNPVLKGQAIIRDAFL